MVEIKKIPGFSQYGATKDGDIWRLDSARTKNVPYKLKGNLSNKGYIRVKIISDSGDKRLVPVHRLILKTFKGEPTDAKTFGCHSDNNSLNNNIENLRWDSCKGNLDDRKIHGTEMHGEKNGRAKLTPQLVSQIRAEFSGKYGEVSKLSRKYNVANSQMWEICHGRSW